MAACMRCGQIGHLAAQCSQPPTCNNCGGKGHLAKACPAIRCDRCGRAGHMARECTKGGNMRCYECGENGHISRDCPVAEKKRHRKPMDPDAKRKEHETTQFHRARGQMMTYNNLALPLKSKRAPDVDDSQTKKPKFGTLRAVTVVKPKIAGAAGSGQAPDAVQSSAGAQQGDQHNLGDGGAGSASGAEQNSLTMMLFPQCIPCGKGEGARTGEENSAVLGLALAEYGSDSD